MNEPDEHQRVLELLRRARRPPEEITPERLEENLRWLIRSTRPEAAASEALRQRVEAMAAAHRTRRHSPFARFLGCALPENWRARAGAVSLGLACVVLLLLLTIRAPAQMLARTLQAMAQVRSAHCTGWRVVYRIEGEGLQLVPERMRVEWWYRAPNWYRNEMEPQVPGGEVPSNRLIVKGDRNVFTTRFGATAGISTTLSPPLLTRHMSSLDFFSEQGFLHRAEAEKAGQVTYHEATYHDRPVQIVEVEALEPQATGRYREHWTLYVDPSSDLVLQSESRLDRQARDNTWQTLEKETLDRLDYNVPVKDRLFDTEPLAQPRRPNPP